MSADTHWETVYTTSNLGEAAYCHDLFTALISGGNSFIWSQLSYFGYSYEYFAWHQIWPIDAVITVKRGS
ncbi:hypothetical protein FYK55_24480 [Roseiconus nitratireducens]|uniref:Uncharacterized protein n=1 Tax=Roseiconus nitratireducens TaxID=2605748 RepID=A0A5M6CZN4_9BACT|nr:hypothetical protein FYK55_24480 [Roseiconus nitratireducens]